MKSLSQALRIAVAMLRMPPILLKHENLIRCVVAVATVQKQNGEDRDRRLVLPSFNQPIWWNAISYISDTFYDR